MKDATGIAPTHTDTLGRRDFLTKAVLVGAGAALTAAPLSASDRTAKQATQRISPHLASHRKLGTLEGRVLGSAFKT